MDKETKQCQNCKKEFIVEPEDFQFYEKMGVPPPTFCWKCRLQRRLVWRNERILFRGKSAKSGKNLITIIPPNSGIKVYDENEWWADDWDPMEYARDYDPSKPFFKQFHSLQMSVPLPSRNVIHMVNSDYSANAGELKNCYLIFNATGDEDCAYGAGVNNSRACFDNANIDKCERCYQSFWIINCYQTFFSVQCVDCLNTWFSKNCRGCNNCVGCANLTNKQYHIFNKPYSKEEYNRKLEEFKLETWTGIGDMSEQAREFWLKFPNKFIQGVRNVDVTGAYLTDCKNVKYGYLVRQSKDCKYCQYLQDPNNEDLYDITIWGGNVNSSYESSLCGYGTTRIRFCVNSYNEVHDLDYCFFCGSSSDLFGCVGLRKKQYCILNKQYSKEEYESLRTKIISDMNENPYKDKKGRVYPYGEFFPAELSPFGYNNTLAFEHFPMSKEEILANGYGWVDVDKSEYETNLDASDLPDSVKDADESVLDKIIKCSECGRAYRIIRSEFEFLKAEKIPLPRSCMECRHKSRLLNRNGVSLYSRKCDCAGSKSKNGTYVNFSGHSHGDNSCPNQFETSYSPDKKEIVYCEACYNAEVV